MINAEASDLRTKNPPYGMRCLDQGEQADCPTYRLMTEEGETLALGDQSVFGVRQAPDRLPSDYLVDLERQGWTVVENIMSPEMVSNLIENINQVRAENADKEAQVKAGQDSRPYKSNDNLIRPRSLMPREESFLGMTPAVAQALMHPVSLWLIESYFGVDDIHYCQCPGFSILRPAEKIGDNARVEPGGWHADYPYPLNSENEAHTYMLGPRSLRNWTHPSHHATPTGNSARTVLGCNSISP